MTEPTAPVSLADVAAKLDRVLTFLDRLERHMPLLERFAAMADNPAAKFLMRAGKR